MIEKHSLTLQGHATSVSLEPEFWQAFCQIAKRDGKGINKLVERIDAARDEHTNLASAIRLFVLADFRSRVDA